MIGWAVTVGGEIDMRTVGPTRRSAIVNWLVVDREELITHFTTDQAIDTLWSVYESENIKVQQVNVEVTSRTKSIA